MVSDVWMCVCLCVRVLCVVCVCCMCAVCVLGVLCCVCCVTLVLRVLCVTRGEVRVHLKLNWVHIDSKA